ncbi:hypothetical protein [Hymenobacter sp. DG01]|uniref:hypothetical protein n=1 Tax=Hymenobacter sp. DG01 TaxID=2584940 RepID=UPI0011204290|nr:hypothetical protein [Hymenobacter sp. DG01]
MLGSIFLLCGSLLTAAPDTLKPIPMQSLAEVTVRPGQTVTVTPFGAKVKPLRTYSLVAGTNIAVHLPASTHGTISQIQVQLKPTDVRAGRLRVQLLAAPVGEVPTVPESATMLPAPIMVSAQQMKAAPKGLLTLDVSAHDLAMPAGGVFVVVEGLGSETAPNYVAITVPSKGSGSPLVVTGGTDGYETSHLNEWAELELASSEAEPRTWIKGTNGKGWILRKPKEDPKKVMNSRIAVVMVADK